MRRRQGFTIVELLVAMALIIFIMVILTEAFSAGLETFRQLKAIGDMQERLRSAIIIMRRDLRADHFENDLRGSRLSDQDMRYMEPPDKGYFRLWQVCRPNPNPGFANPIAPFLCSDLEGSGFDADGIPSTRATDQVLQFTVQLRGSRPDSFFVGQLPTAPAGPYSPQNPPTNPNLQTLGPPDFQQPNSMISSWAEVAYFVRPLVVAGTNPPVPITANGTPLFALYRRQRLLGPDNAIALPNTEAWEWRFYTDVSFPQPFPLAAPGTVVLNGTSSITVPTNRLGMDPQNTVLPAAPVPTMAGVPSTILPNYLPKPAGYPDATDVWTVQDLFGSAGQLQSGDDLLITNLISFDVKVLQQGYNQASGAPYAYFVDLPHSQSPLSSNSTFKNYVTTTTPIGVSVFDTWSKQGAYSNWNTPGTATSLPLKMRILALQITLRVWDEKSQQARQVTFIQDM